MARISAGLAVVAVGALTLVGCSPRNSAESGGGSPAVQAGTQASTQADSLADVDPCSLVSPTDAAKAHLNTPGRDFVDKEKMRDCEWTSADSSNPDFVLDVGIEDHGSVGSLDLSGHQITRTTIGGYQAVQDYKNGQCGVMLVYSDSSYVETGSNATGQDACQLAQLMSQGIAKSLPAR